MRHLVLVRSPRNPAPSTRPRRPFLPEQVPITTRNPANRASCTAKLPAPPAVLPNDGRWGNKGTWTPDRARLHGHCQTDWAPHVFEPSTDDFLFRATLRIDAARAAGLVFRLQGDNVMDGAYVVLLDVEAGAAVFTATRVFPLLDMRKFKVARGQTRVGPLRSESP